MLLLLRERLLELELRLLPLEALGLLLRLELELLRLGLLRPLEALALLLREDDAPDLEEEEELRDAIACSLESVEITAVASDVASATTVNLGRWSAATVGMPCPSA